MYTIEHGKSRIHFNGDFSGKVIIFDGKKTIEVPGRLFQKVIEHCVSELADNIADNIKIKGCLPWGKSVFKL